jgi:hypothetical protein
LLLLLVLVVLIAAGCIAAGAACNAPAGWLLGLIRSDGCRTRRICGRWEGCGCVTYAPAVDTDMNLC